MWHFQKFQPLQFGDGGGWFPDQQRSLWRVWPCQCRLQLRSWQCSINNLSSDIKSGNDLTPESPTVRAFWCTLCACVSVTYMPQWNRFCFDTILVHDVILWLFYNNSQRKQTSLGFSNYYLWFLDIAALRYWRIPSFFQGHRMLTFVPASLSQQPDWFVMSLVQYCFTHLQSWSRQCLLPWSFLYPDVVKLLNMVSIFWCFFL